MVVNPSFFIIWAKDSDAIGLHLRNIYKSGVLTEEATTDKYSVVQKEGTRNVTRNLKLYNLDAVISVGYRVNSKRGVQFRIWANKVIKDFLIKVDMPSILTTSRRFKKSILIC